MCIVNLTKYIHSFFLPLPSPSFLFKLIWALNNFTSCFILSATEIYPSIFQKENVDEYMCMCLLSPILLKRIG